jgi:PhoH-like ATPase
MENNKKTYVLDTNVLLSDASALTAFQNNDVVLPLIVLEELDRHKDRQDDVGREARETSRKLNKLLQDVSSDALAKGIPLDNGGTLFLLSIEQVEEGKSLVIPSELSEKRGDNVIVHFCLAMQKTKPIVLVTRDVLLSVKAKALGIPCETYRRIQAVSSTDQLYTGSMDLICDIDFDKAYSEEGLALTDLTPFMEELPIVNQFISVSNGKSKGVLLRYRGPNKPLKVVDIDSVDVLKCRNKEQRYCADLLMDPEIKLVSMVGLPGSGKTIFSIAAGLEQTIGAKKRYKTLIVTKPVLPMGGNNSDIGFLPGPKEEKMLPWIAPIHDNLRFLMSSGTGRKTKKSEENYIQLFEQGIIEVEALMYMRGRSIANSFMIIDESQNLSLHELKTIITRVGEGTKIVLTGDISQIDASYLDKTTNGLAIAIEKFKGQSIAGAVLLKKGERSALATLAASILD